MPLAPEARAVLDWIATANLPSYPAVGAVEARLIFKRGRMALQPPPPEVASVSQRSIPGPHGPIPVRVVRPIGTDATSALPVLVFFHGGGWTIGDLDTHDTLCRTFANEARCCVVSVDYRMGPENKFPRAVDDSFAATRWVSDHGPELHIDRDRIAVGGDSAGGNLAAVVALLARDAGGPPLAFQLLIYPTTDVEADYPSTRELGRGHLLTAELMAWFRDCYVRTPADHADWRCSPLRAPDLSRLPPAFVMTAEYDPLRDEGRAYADRLRAAGVDVTYSCKAGMIHGFVTMGKAIPAANRAITEAASALAAALAR